MSNETPIENESGGPPPRRFSRRTVLKAALGVLGTVIASSIPDVLLPKSGISPQDVENKFNIKILSQGKNIIGITTFEAIEWQEYDLLTLINILHQLPPHLYSPRRIDSKVEILRVGLSDHKRGSFCSCNNLDRPDVLSIKKSDLYEESEDYYGDIVELKLLPIGVTAVTHELIHRFTNTEGGFEKYVDSILKPIGLDDTAAFKEAFKDILVSPTTPTTRKNQIGYGATNFSEFFSVAGEVYLGGKDIFVKVYERFLGKERAEKLYNGMKQEIFRGKEY